MIVNIIKLCILNFLVNLKIKNAIKINKKEPNTDITPKVGTKGE